MGLYTHECMFLQRDGVQFPLMLELHWNYKAGITNRCEPPNVCADNQTLTLCMSSGRSEMLSLQAPNANLNCQSDGI